MFAILVMSMGTLLAQNARDDYENSYLTVESLADNNTVKLKIPAALTTAEMTSVSYSTDQTNWTTVQIDNSSHTITVVLNQGQKAYFKGLGNQCCITDESIAIHFTSTDNYMVYGNVMSLFYDDDFASHTEFAEGSNHNLAMLFYSSHHLVSAENLILPATTMTNYCYWGMFASCESLTAVPALPAIVLDEGCYSYMFADCSSLTVAPVLPATTMAFFCYGYMFDNCPITEAPALPATTCSRASCCRIGFRCPRTA